MAPPPRRQPPAGVNVQQLLRARQAQGLELPPNMLRAFEETQTPAQQAEFQQRYTWVTEPVPTMHPDVPPGFAGLSDPNAPRADVPPGGTTIVVPLDPEAERRHLDADRRSGPQTIYGGAPGGAGPATFGDPGEQSETAPASPQREHAELSTRTDALGVTAPAPPERGGTAAMLVGGTLGPEGFSFTIPGVEGQGLVPAYALASEEAFAAFIRSTNQNFEGTVTQSLAPGAVALAPAAQRALIAAFEVAVARENAARAQAQAPTGPGEPRMTMSVREQQVFPGQVDPATQAALTQAGVDVSRAMGAYQGAGAMLNVGREAAGTALGEAQQAAAQQAMQEAQARAERLQGQLQAVQQRIDDVSRMRVSQEEAFGGMGGRIGAGIAVALGQLGSALGGGPNAALAIVNGIVDRNLRAQESNIANQRAGAQMAGNALQQMRGILGDEAAAREAARAMHLAGFQNQLQGMLAGLTGTQAQRGQELLALIQQQRGLAEQATAQMAATTQRRELRYSMQGRQSQVLGQAANLPPMGAPAPQAQARTTGAPAPQQAQARGPSAPATGSRPAGQTSSPRPQTRTGTPAAPRRQTFPLVSSEGLAEATENLRETMPADLPPGIRPRFAGGRPVTGWQQDFMSNLGSEGERQRLRDIRTELSVWRDWTRRIVELNDNLDAELTDGDPDAATVRAMADLLRMIVRHRFTGAAFSEQERADFVTMLPPPGQITASNLLEVWNTFASRWYGFANAQLDYLDRQLESSSLEADREELRTPELVRAAGAAAQERATSEAARERTREQNGSMPFNPFEISPLGSLITGYRALFGGE